MLLLSLLVLLVVEAVCDAPVTIDGSDAYRQQRACAFRCFNNFDDPGYPIAQDISCPTFKVQNDCFCRLDLQLDANRYISSCISGQCSKNALDISMGTKLYNDYCTSNGYTRASQVIATATGTGSSPSSSPIITTPPGVVALPAPSSNSPPSTSSDSSSSSSSGLAGGEIAGIVVGSISAVATVIGVIFGWKTYKRSKNRTSTAAPIAHVQELGPYGHYHY